MTSAMGNLKKNIYFQALAYYRSHQNRLPLTMDGRRRLPKVLMMGSCILLFYTEDIGYRPFFSSLSYKFN